MIEYVNDFFTVVCGINTGGRSTNVEVDIDGYNSIIIRNEGGSIVSVPSNAVVLYKYDKVEIKGKDNEICKGKLQIKFLNSFFGGRVVFIRKKFKK